MAFLRAQTARSRALWSLALALLVVLLGKDGVVHAGTGGQASLLGYGEIADPGDAAILRWITLVSHHRAQLSRGDGFLREQGLQESARVRWHELVHALRDAPDRAALLDRVNRAVNRVAYRRDDELWGLQDRWATPLEFLSRGGDCEDFSATKYLLLHELGVAHEDMRMVVIDRPGYPEAHSLLAVRLDGRFVYLDSDTMLILEEHELTRVEPLYAVSNRGGYRYLHNGGDVSSVLAIAGSRAATPPRAKPRSAASAGGEALQHVTAPDPKPDVRVLPAPTPKPRRGH